MEKILKILIGIVLAILLFFWLSSMFKGCNQKTDPLMSDVTTTSADVYEEDEFDEDFFEDNSSVVREPVQNKVEEVVEDVYEEVDEIVRQEPKPQPKPVAKPEPVRKTSSPTYSSGRYMVLAGSYMIEGNAEKQVTKLKNQGYSGAQVVYFDDSKYHSVVAYRSNDYNEAQRISSALKRKGIDNYVHTQKD